MYKVQLRKLLLASGWITLHRASTGRRSGQLTLLEVTEEGYEVLASMRIRANRPRGRGGFLHRYYAFKVKQYAEITWPGCVAIIEDGSQGRPADVTVQPSGQPSPTIAFEIFVTSEDKEIRGILRDVELFGEIVVCALTPAALESLENRARDTLGDPALQTVRFELVSKYLVSDTGKTEASQVTVESEGATRPWRARRARTGSDQQLKPKSNIEKSATKSDTEAETQNSSPIGKRPGRRRKLPLMEQVEQAYLNLHNWDRLQECDLAKLPEVQQMANPRQVMAEAQLLRGILIKAARKVIVNIISGPDKRGVRIFLERHLEGKNVTEIAKEIGVSRNWVNKSYRPEAFRLAAMQFVRDLSAEA